MIQPANMPHNLWNCNSDSAKVLYKLFFKYVEGRKSRLHISITFTILSDTNSPLVLKIMAVLCYGGQ